MSASKSFVEQMPLKDVPRGEFVRRKLDAKKTYTRGDYDRASRTYALDDWDDISRAVYLKGAALVWVGFEF
tara:strand:- start:230 stop:442 length:213 start_codon:yes stop_codon:yes gene_type:complete